MGYFNFFFEYIHFDLMSSSSHKAHPLVGMIPLGESEDSGSDSSHFEQAIRSYNTASNFDGNGTGNSTPKTSSNHIDDSLQQIVSYGDDDDDDEMHKRSDGSFFLRHEDGTVTINASSNHLPENLENIDYYNLSPRTLKQLHNEYPSHFPCKKISKLRAMRLIPPEPPGKADSRVQEKIKKFLSKDANFNNTLL